jgi:hypothetical protein
MSDILSKLEEMLKKDVTEPKTPKQEDTSIKPPSFDKLISEIKKRFGDGSVIEAKDNGVILVVRMHHSNYHENQKQLELPAKQEWIYDNGYALLSIQGDVDPGSVKLYFTNNITVKPAK